MPRFIRARCGMISATLALVTRRVLGMRDINSVDDICGALVEIGGCRMRRKLQDLGRQLEHDDEI